ncbi:MAG TPA: UDP-N-acetylmuramate dehydrogenase [Acidimicrobiales bacterium]|nr:UDP-N-acetylmuramate dehydrogenase [Acidimicrobiales bacterium]
MSSAAPRHATSTDVRGRVAHAARLLGERATAGEPLGPRTTYRVGGSAALFVAAADEAELATVSAVIAESGVDVLVVGNGSNLLVPDGGYAGLAVALLSAFADLQIDRDAGTISAGAAVAYPVLARQSAAAGLTGMEWAVGIPGSVGGAVAMNAGGHGASTSDRLLEARVLDLSTGMTRTAGPAELDLSYRHSNIGPREIVLGAVFACERGDPGAASAAVASIVRWRREHQPGGRNAGSVFTNPPGDSAGRLVDAAGLKGMRVRSAVVSEKHANFIQVDPDGSADDVLELVELVRTAVAERTGVVLATELRVAGRRDR